MNINTLTSKILALTGIAVFVLGLLLATQGSIFAGDGGIDALECDLVATTTVAIGHQTPTRIVQGHARNATVILSQPFGATNTIAVGFGASSTLTGSGYTLGAAQTGAATSTPDRLMLGLNTDFPFVGDIYALTNAGSSTVGVTVCRYDN